MINRTIISILISLFITSCATVENPVFSSLYFGPENISIDEAKYKVMQYVKSGISSNKFFMPSDACSSLGIYNLKAQPVNYPYEICVSDAKSFFDAEKKQIDEKNRLESIQKQEAERAIALAKKEREKAEQKAKEDAEKAKHDQLVSNIKTGKKQPSSIEEFEILYDAKNGAFLSSSPKIKPDNKYYSILGAINYMESDDVIVAKLLTENRYFKVRIPDNIKQEFEKTAKVNGIFGFVGKYTENSDVLLVLFQSVQVPVFDAVHFKAANFDDNK